MQQVTRREAYERLKPVLTQTEEEIYRQVTGRGIARYEEDPHGGASITVLGYDYPLYARNPDGTVYGYGYNGQRYNYSLFNTAAQRHVTNIVTAIDIDIRNRVLAKAEEQPWFDATDSEHAAAAIRHAHRITGRLIRPTKYAHRVKHLNKTLYRLYDPQLFKLLMRVTWGYDRDALAYNNLIGVQDPHDVPLPVLAAYISLTRHHRDGDIDEPDRRDPIEVTQFVRETLARHGALRRATWRYLLKLPPRHVAYTLERLTATDQQLEFIDLLARAGETPRFTTLKLLIRGYGHLKGNRGEQFDPTQFVQYARMLARHTAKMRGIQAFENLEPHTAILDWLGSGVTLTPTQAALPYAWWSRRAQEWHDDPNGPVQRRLRQERARDRHHAAITATLAPINDRYHHERETIMNTAVAEYAVNEHKHRGITITPLTTTAQLQREGDTMQHCVANYAHAVMRSHSRIYHLESANEKSTIELRHDGHRWRINQHHGPKNRRPSEEHLKTGRALLRKYNETHPQPHEDLLAALEERYRQEIEEAKTRAIQQATTAELAARGTPPRHAAPANHPAQATH